MPRLTILAAAAFALWPAAASACDTGPWPLEYRRGSTVRKMTVWGNPLASAVAMRDISKRDDRVRITVYNSGASSPALWEARIVAARAELIKHKVPRDRIEIVRVKTQGGMLGREWIGRTTKMTVELAKGCGG